MPWEGRAYRGAADRVGVVTLCVRPRRWLQRHGVLNGVTAGVLRLSRELLGSDEFQRVAAGRPGIACLTIDVSVGMRVVEAAGELTEGSPAG